MSTTDDNVEHSEESKQKVMVLSPYVIIYRIIVSLLFVLPLSIIILFLLNKGELKGIFTNNYWAVFICIVMSFILTAVQVKKNFIDRIFPSEGMGLLEWALIIVLLGVAAIAAWRFFRGEIKTVVNDPPHDHFLGQ